MMSPTRCRRHAVACETRGAACAEPAIRAHWLEMAGEWRSLGQDGTAQATTARLMLRRRVTA
jgi:hypothetical protein